MRKILHNLITPPIFEDDAEKTRLARLLHVILLTVMTLLIVFSIPAFVLTPQLGRLLIELTLAGWSIFMLFLLLRGYVRQAAFLMSLTLWAGSPTHCVAKSSATVSGSLSPGLVSVASSIRGPAAFT